MNVAVAAEYYPRRRDPALGVWAHRQALAASEAGAEVSVLVLERPLPPRASPARAAEALRQPAREVRDGIEAQYVRFVAPPRGGSYAWWDRWARRPLTRALERRHRERPLDLVHAHYALPAGAAALPFCRSRRVPLCVSVHGGDVLGPELQRPAARSRVADVLQAAGLVMCNSRATLRAAAALAGRDDHMRVVHLGAAAPDPPPPRHERPTVVSLGDAVPRKRQADVLRAVRLARDEVPALRAVLIGGGPELGALETLAGSLGIAEVVEIRGRMAPAEALAELARGHVMALPSVDEAFGVAYVEALACGLPAIGCRGEWGPEEIAAEGPGMLLVPPGDVPALASAITGALEPGRHRELSEAARRTAAASFSWKACGRATVEAYAEALA
ncbi:MAG TPA: glycosyltransferase [Thermoleophilaceae bacterium]|nr:glycosyltransferase [Thermoleophilaceae bacterium]